TRVDRASQEQSEALHHRDLDEHVTQPQAAEVQDEASLETGWKLAKSLPPEDHQREQDEQEDEERSLGQDQELRDEHHGSDVVILGRFEGMEVPELVVLVEERLVVGDDRDVEGIPIDELFLVARLQ